MEPRGEPRPDGAALASVVRDIDPLAPGPKGEPKRQIVWPPLESPPTASPSPSPSAPRSGPPKVGSPWLNGIRGVKHSKSAQTLSSASEAARARAFSSRSLTGRQTQDTDGVTITSPLAPPPLPAQFAHLTNKVPTPVLSPTTSDVLLPYPSRLRAQFSSTSLRSILGFGVKSPTVDSVEQGNEATLSQAQKRVRQEAERDAKEESKMRKRLTKDVDPQAAKEAEHKANVKTGKKLIARSSVHGWVTQKPLTELTQEEFAAVGAAVMETEPEESGRNGLREMFTFVGVQRAKVEYENALQAHREMCRQAKLDDMAKRRQNQLDLAAVKVTDAADRPRDPNAARSSRRMSQLQWYNATMAILEGESLEEVTAAATRDPPETGTSNHGQGRSRYHGMIDDFEMPVPNNPLNLPDDLESEAGEPHEEREKTLRKLTGEYYSSKNDSQTKGLGIFYPVDGGEVQTEDDALSQLTITDERPTELRHRERTTSVDDDEFRLSFLDPQMRRLHPATSGDDSRSICSYTSNDSLPLPSMVPAPLNVRSPQAQQLRSFTGPFPPESLRLRAQRDQQPRNVTAPLLHDPFAAEPSTEPHPSQRGHRPFRPLRNDDFFQRVNEERAKRIENQTDGLVHPLFRPADLTEFPKPPIFANSSRSSVKPAASHDLLNASVKPLTITKPPKPTIKHMVSHDSLNARKQSTPTPRGNLQRRVTASQSSPVHRFQYPSRGIWFPSLPPTGPVPPVPDHNVFIAELPASEPVESSFLSRRLETAGQSPRNSRQPLYDVIAQLSESDPFGSRPSRPLPATSSEDVVVAELPGSDTIESRVHRAHPTQVTGQSHGSSGLSNQPVSRHPLRVNDVTPTRQMAQVHAPHPSGFPVFRSLDHFLRHHNGNTYIIHDSAMGPPQQHTIPCDIPPTDMNVLRETQVHTSSLGSTQPLAAVYNTVEDEDETIMSATDRAVSPTSSDSSTIRPKKADQDSAIPSSTELCRSDHDGGSTGVAMVTVRSTLTTNERRAALCSTCPGRSLTECGGCNVSLCKLCSTMCQHMRCLRMLCRECAAVGMCDPHLHDYYTRRDLAAE